MKIKPPKSPIFLSQLFAKKLIFLKVFYLSLQKAQLNLTIFLIVKGRKDDKENYRPVSILPTSKI